MLRRRNTLLGLGDGGAHVGFISDGSIPTHPLTYWGRDRDRFPLPELIRGQTSETAHAVELHDRGVLAPSLKADLNMINFAWRSTALTWSTTSQPAGGG